jgi:D-alanyl-D-alanine carboxypeptidase/D-alanyl-D-alanine-endopeptidase (penicillin-binding protein 4)
LFRWGPVVLVVVLLAGAVTAYHYDLGSRWFGAQPEAAPTTPPVPGLTLEPVPTPRAVARPAPSGRVSPIAVRRALGPALDDPDLGDLRAVVAPLRGAPVLDDGLGTSMPASTLKLLTTTAALETLGPDHTFATRVVTTGRNRLTLVGGGDPYLTGKRPRDPADRDQASLQGLAARTARALTGRGVRSVTLSYDTSLFTGPELSPHWPKSYVPDNEVSPITSLWVDQGINPDGDSRQSDPAAVAAAQFAGFLRRAGVRVTGAVAHRTAPTTAREVARVTSRPVSDLVEQVLKVSDNEGAEVLARQTGIAVNGQGSFDGGAAAVRQVLTALGIDLDNATIHDGSGLSRADRLDPTSLVSVLQLAASADHPELRPVLTGLPVAAFDGSLEDRFDDSRGRGWARAKTGTLHGTSGLAGIVTDARGRPLVFAFLGNHIKPLDTLDARAALEDLVTALATCRC